MIKLALAMAMFAVAGGATAPSWVERAWDRNDNPGIGLPSITYRAIEGGDPEVSIVLPNQVIADSVDGGTPVEELARQFLSRWAPSTCSSIIDMTVPHPGLRVEVRVQESFPLYGTWFHFSDPQGADYVINYSPYKAVKCVDAPEYVGS